MVDQNGNFGGNSHSLGDTFGFSGAEKGEYAKASYYRLDKNDNGYKLIRETTLKNPVAPVEAILTDSGFLITIDNWHNVGFGEIVVIYTPEGIVQKSYRLIDLYEEEKIEKMDFSVSSVLWRCGAYPPHANYGKLEIFDSFGGLLSFDYLASTFEYSKKAVDCTSD